MNIVKKEVHHRLNTNLEEDFLYFVELPLFSSLSWSPCSPSWPPKCVWWQRSCSTASVVMLPPSHCARCLVPPAPGVALCARYLQVAAGVSSQDDLHHRSHLRYTAWQQPRAQVSNYSQDKCRVRGYHCLLSSTLQAVLGIIHLLLVVADLRLLGMCLGHRFHNVSNLGKAFSCPCNL